MTIVQSGQEAPIELVESVVLQALADLVKSRTPAEIAARCGVSAPRVRIVLRRLMVRNPALVEFDQRLIRWRTTPAGHDALQARRRPEACGDRLAA